MKPVLLVLAQTGYQDHELQGTRAALLAAGFSVRIASKEAGACTGKFGGTETADLAMRDADVLEYACVAFIGGPGMAAYADDEEACYLAQATAMHGVLLGAICIAPLVLARAGVLAGGKATVWDPSTGSGQVPTVGGPIGVLQECGAIYTGEDVTTDGLIVTANGPKAATVFGEALVGKLKT